MPQKATCPTHTRTEEEHAIVQEEADSAKDKAEEVRPIKITRNFGKKSETIKQCWEEGGASMPIQFDKATQSPRRRVPKEEA